MQAGMSELVNMAGIPIMVNPVEIQGMITGACSMESPMMLAFAKMEGMPPDQMLESITTMAREALDTANAAVRTSLPQEKAEVAKARLSMQQSTISAQQL